MDALVAEKVMGEEVWNGLRAWKRIQSLQGFPEATGNWINPTDVYLHTGAMNVGELPHYSTDIAAAWKVMVAVANGRRDRYPTLWQDKGTNLWVCEFGSVQDGWCDTAPLAICRAALRAVS
jgi:hypothetical protein